ncbi:MAG: hypothetical protein K8T10_05180 [Candidatus Eremiobacteraeota bacterium]|nr:hypothetical protein [Candidatus Eremiobacteraeota bacterium]
MDGIGFIGGPKNISGMSGTRKSAPPKPKSEPTQVKDGVVTGYFNGPEIQDPREAFNFAKPEVKLPISEDTNALGGSSEITAEAYFLSGASDQFGSFNLNGPSSPQGGIETLSGVKLGNSNPKFLFQE